MTEHPCCGCKHCGIPTTTVTPDSSVYYSLDCDHFKQLLRIPKTLTKFNCRYFAEKK